jgi:phenylalanyl-tRNA synthetase beta chain
MKFSESWLRSWVNPALSSEALSHLLTMAGLEVEARDAVAPAFNNVVVAQVLSKEKHPDADRLNVLHVDVGQAEPLLIVCGAQNVSVGMKAPCALVGAKLPKIEIKQAKVRGIASFGMMCSAVELGLAEVSDGLLVLSDEAQVGQNIRQHLDLDDTLLTLKLTPNRCDCLSLYGIAREVAALTGTPLQTLAAPTFQPNNELRFPIKVSASAACPRYSGRVIRGLNAQAPTPAWMVQRLERCGLRSLSVLVDVTNYVLLELGQPLHAFDLNKLNGEIEVRFAREGEKINTLNNQEVIDLSEMLVIADVHGPVALAGVMGGADSAVSNATTAIFLESAFFAPSVIAGKSRRLGFGSDSAYRFERGVDFALTQIALDRATQLILDCCGGEAGALNEVVSELPARPPVKLRPARVQSILGVALSAAEMAKIVQALGMECQAQGEDFLVTPPSYRFDIVIEEDLIEEIARVYGYENIQPVPPTASMTLLPQPEALRPVSRVRQILVQRDYQEAINYAFVEAAWERDFCANTTPIALQNPIASQMSVMRSSLLGGLLSALRTNLGRKQPRVRLFELGACFKAELGVYVQSEKLAGLAYGSAQAEQWAAPARAVDFYDVKGDVEALFAPRLLSFQALPHPASHPGRSAQISFDGKAIGWIGELHPQWQQQQDLPQAVVWFELDLAALLEVNVPTMNEVSKLPPVRRDLAVLVDENVEVADLLAALALDKTPFVVEFGLFDVYRGKGVAEGKKSLAFRVLLQDTKKTLTEIEIEQSVLRLIQVLEKHGAQIRI